MRPYPSFAFDEIGWFIVHYLWTGALVGVFALGVRYAVGWKSPERRYAFSLAVLSLLAGLGAGWAAVIFLPFGFWEFLSLPGIVLPAWVFQILPAVWGGVSFLLLVLLLIGMIGAWRLRWATIALPPEIQILADRVANGQPGAGGLKVRICRRIGEPILLGVFRPMILLPSAVALRLRPEQLELILLHELAHIRRRDNLVLLLQRLAEIVFWFQPAVWMVSRWVSRDREFCCDEAVVKESGARRLYAETLIALAEMGRPRPAIFLGAFFGRDHVFARIRYILNSEEALMSRSRSLVQAAVLGSIALVGLFALSSPPTEAVADPPAATLKPVVPPKVVVPPKPPAVVPAPAIPQPAVTLPPTYTQKPEIIVQPPAQDESETRLEPQPGADPPEPTTLVPLEQTTPSAKRAWGPEQVEGPPDTEGAGDIQTAWASQTQDSQKEWLLCEYAESVLPSAIVVYETYNPGSLEKVTAFDEAGEEHEVWTGTDPTPRTAARGTSIIPIKTKFKTKKVKLFFDSPAVPGWNEIDAVGLRPKEDENMQWAKKVTASSTYAQNSPPPAPPMVVVPAEDLRKLQEDVNQLKQEMQRLKQIEADLKELKQLIKAMKDDK